jgi:TolB-like protein/Flp pilus assembly protein TadD
MASIIPGYEYDIFISYRQKDNKHDGWVTEFVNNLKGELESTFKEEISVYFDINPHDGLLETHNVDASLKEKLKCLIFIPVISQTFCDPQSFAWQHEFVAFNIMAKEDKFGRDIRLAGGNVASRILPIKIHDLDPEDKTLLENELGGVLRSIEFIYMASGVNRPLKPNDDRTENLNHTYYRDQINKVANAVKEIINAIKKHNQQDGEVKKEVIRVKPDPPKNLKVKIITGSLLVLVLIALGYFFIPKQSKSSEPVEKSIAVLPFLNLSNDSTQLFFCDGIMDDILNNLQKVKSFTVRPRTSSYQYRDTKKSTLIIGKELNVNYLVSGSVGREGNNLKIRVSLIDSKADKEMWANDYPGEMNQLFSVQSEIAKKIASELKAELTTEEIKKIEKKPTKNPEAYNYYLQGNYDYWKTYGSGDNNSAIELYEKAIRLDPGFALAYTGISKCLLDQYFYYRDHSENTLRKSKQAIDKAFEIDPDFPDAHLALGIYYYRGYLKYPEALKQFELVLKYQPKNPEAVFWSACVHRRAGNWEMAKSEFEKAVELNPGRSDFAEDAGETYDLLRDYSKAEEFYNISVTLKPEWVLPYPFLSRMYLRWEGDTRKAREILGNAARNNKTAISDSLIIETNVLIDIYEGKYEEALKDISLFKYDVIQTQFYFRPKYLYNAVVYGLMNKPESEHAYYDSARVFLERRIVDMPDDPRLLSSLGIVYAGLGLDDKAIITSKRAVKLLPVEKEVYKGIYLVEDLALIYVMTGKYDEAIEQIKYLLSIPGFLTPKILEIDPRWAPLKNQPEFKKMMESYSDK